MVFDKIPNLSKYSWLLPYIKTVVDFLNENDLKKLPLGKRQIDDNKVFTNVMEYETKSVDEKATKLECHRNYADIHLVIGEEKILTDNSEDLKRVENYKPDDDVEFFTGENLSEVILKGSNFVIFMPGEAHQSGLAIGHPKSVRKIVFKVKIKYGA